MACPMEMLDSGYPGRSLQSGRSPGYAFPTSRKASRLIYLYVFTTSDDEVPTTALEHFQAAHPQRTGLKPGVIGTRTVDGLPDVDEDFARQTATTACEEAGVAFDPDRDGAAYAIEEVDGEKYGVLEIDAQRYPKVSALAVGALFFIVGLALGVTTLSVWLLAAGFGGFVAYLWVRGPARQGREGWLIAFGPTLLVSWIAGFVVRGVLF